MVRSDPMLKRLLLFSERGSIASLAVPALTLPPLLATKGPAMAAGLQLYGGNPEPSIPSLAFPWLPALGLALGALGLAAVDLVRAHWALRWSAILGLLVSCGVSVDHLLDLTSLAAE